MSTLYGLRCLTHGPDQDLPPSSGNQFRARNEPGRRGLLAIVSVRAEFTGYANGLPWDLSEWLVEHAGCPAVVVIDEYDEVQEQP